MPRRGGNYIESPWGDIGEPLGQLLAALLFGKDYKAARQAKEELSPIMEKERLTGETAPGEAYLKAQGPKQSQRIQKHYTKQTGETVPSSDVTINIPSYLLNGQPPPVTPGTPPEWPTTEAGREIRTQSERAKGTPTSQLPLYAQEETKVREQELAVNPFKILSGIDPALQPAAAKALDMSFTPDLRSQYPFYSDAATALRMFDNVTNEEFDNWARTGQPPTHPLHERPSVNKLPPNVDFSPRIDRYAEMYSYGVESGKITQAQYNYGLLKLINSDYRVWPDPVKDFPPFTRPGTDPNNTQDRQIANELGMLQEDVSRIRKTGTDVEQEDLMRKWQASINKKEGLKAAKFQIIESIRLGKKKEAEMYLLDYARAMGLTPQEQKGWVAKAWKGLRDFFSGPKENQPTPEQAYGYLDRIAQPTASTAVTSSGQQPPSNPIVPKAPTATSWIDEQLRKK